MGCVLSEEQKQAIEATKVSKQINKSIQEDYKRSLKEVKFLLLGKFQRWEKEGGNIAGANLGHFYGHVINPKQNCLQMLVTQIFV